jgi:hypothetical protein
MYWFGSVRGGAVDSVAFAGVVLAAGVVAALSGLARDTPR